MQSMARMEYDDTDTAASHQSLVLDHLESKTIRQCAAARRKTCYTQNAVIHTLNDPKHTVKHIAHGNLDSVAPGARGKKKLPKRVKRP